MKVGRQTGRHLEKGSVSVGRVSRHGAPGDDCGCGQGAGGRFLTDAAPADCPQNTCSRIGSL